MRHYWLTISQTAFCLLVFLCLGSFPAIAGNPSFYTIEKTIINPTCPHYSYEVNDKTIIETCPSDGNGNYFPQSQIRLDVCVYEVCTDGKCATAESINKDTGGADYDYCALIAAKANDSNNYCSLITGAQSRQQCNRETPFSWNWYWLSYYGRLILPALLIGLFLLFIKASRSEMATGASITLSNTILAVFSNDAYGIDLVLYSRSIFQSAVILLPLLSAILFVIPKTRKTLLPLLLVFNIIDVLFLLLFILLPKT
jgi:hypothetical protein